MTSQRAYLGCLVAAAVLGGVSGHGYVKSPVSRAYGCSSGGGHLSRNCGQVQYEPQSVEGPDGWPSRGPGPGQVASAGSAKCSALNAQSGDRWGKVTMSAGSTPFTWLFTAAHVTRDFRYFITRVGWDASRPLDASSFEAAPFCVLDYGMKKPPAEFTHDCTVPTREGYHVVLAIWDVGDTAASFYNVIDVQFKGNGGNVPQPKPTPHPVYPVPPTPQATPVPAPPAQTPLPMQPVPPSGCAKELQMWNGCKQAPGCCASGLTCQRLSAWYSQCRKSTSTMTPPTPPVTTQPQPKPLTPAPVPVPQPQPQPPTSGCAEEIAVWAGCLGNESCCRAGLQCTGNRWWKSCKP